MITRDKLDEIEEKLFRDVESKLEKDLIRLRKEEILITYSEEDKLVSVKEKYEQIKNKPAPEIWNSGFLNLDRETGGFGEGQLVIITGVTKSGKTSLARDFIHNMDSHKPIFFSLEQGIEELIRKDIKYGNPIYDYYVPNQIGGKKTDVDWLEERILEGILKFGSKIVLIDHLHFIIDISNEDRRFDLTITNVVKKLKEIANTYKILIFLVAHLKKTRLEEEPTINDLRDSSSIAQLADKVLLVWREAKKEDGRVKFTGNTYLRIGADRQTGSNEAIILKWEKGRYTEDPDAHFEVTVPRGTFNN